MSTSWKELSMVLQSAPWNPAKHSQVPMQESLKSDWSVQVRHLIGGWQEPCSEQGPKADLVGHST